MKLQESDQGVMVIVESEKDLEEHFKDTEVELTRYVRMKTPVRMCVVLTAVSKVNSLFWGVLSTFTRQQVDVVIKGANERIRNKLRETNFYKLFSVEEPATK